MTSGGWTQLGQALASAVGEVSPDRPLSILELAVRGLTVFQIGVDDAGVTHLSQGVSRTWDDSGSSPSVPIPSGPLIIVTSTPDASAVMVALDRLRSARPDALSWVVSPQTDLRQLLSKTLAESPIRQGYELLVARTDRTANTIRLSSLPLFTTGARRGDVAETTVWCESADSGRTSFVVLARNSSTPRLLWAGSVPLQSGRHTVRAELLGPGIVRFVQPVGVTADPHSLGQILDAVPKSLNSVKQGRIICAVEVSGSPPRVATRLYQAGKIIRKLYEHIPEAGQLKVGIIGYGAHRFEGTRRDDRVVVAKWMSTPSEALDSLGWLGVSPHDDSRAAQIEDMLAEVVHRLGSMQESQPTALVILGNKPPYPSHVDSAIPPCPAGYNWQKLLGDLEQRPDVTIAAIRDDLSSPGVVAWASLGSTILLSLDSVEEYELGRRIRLIASSAQHIPIPIADSGEGASGPPFFR